jgi:hypothetical protein
MALADIVAVNITANSAAPTQVGFGTPLILAHHTLDAVARVREYSSSTALTSMVSDGFTTSHPAYIAATALLSQNPRPPKLKIGRCATAPTWAFTLQCLSAVEGDKYTLTINGEAITYTVLAAATTTSVATALELLVEAVTGVNSTSTADTITLTSATAGTPVRVQAWSNNMKLTETTADPGLAADLAAIQVEDDDWYGLTGTLASKVCIQAVSAWTEAQKKIYATHTSDWANGDPSSTTDVMYAEKALAHARTYLQYNGNDTMGYSGAAILGSRLPSTPGSDTWALKTLSGITVESRKTLTATQESAIRAKNGNVYVVLAGLNKTRRGISPAGEYMDVVRFRDWLEATMQVRVFAYLAGAEKVSYTDTGVDAIGSVIRGTLADGIRAGGLAADPAPTLSTVKVDNVSSTDRAARTYNGFTFTARLAGAIHELTINGTIGV